MIGNNSGVDVDYIGKQDMIPDGKGKVRWWCPVDDVNRHFQLTGSSRYCGCPCVSALSSAIPVEY